MLKKLTIAMIIAILVGGLAYKSYKVYNTRYVAYQVTDMEENYSGYGYDVDFKMIYLRFDTFEECDSFARSMQRGVFCRKLD